MEISILRIGQTEQDALESVQKNLAEAFPKAQTVILKDVMGLAPKAYDAKRKQYYSSLLLTLIREYAEKIDADRILGITNVDLFVPRLNFVFGEAENPGKVAIVSLYRLRPEFYGDRADRTLFLERAAKEATHELGHAFGLSHCSNPLCVMSFSNTIHAVDNKKREFCPKCSLQLFRMIR